MKNKLIGIIQIFVCFLALTQVLNAQCPNLVIEQLQVECYRSASEGDAYDAYQYSYVFANNGTAALNTSATSFVIQSYWSSDMILSPGTDVPAGGFVVGAGTMEIDQKYCGSLGSDSPNSQPVDPTVRPFLIMTIDNNNSVVECDETDNVFIVEFPTAPCEFISPKGLFSACADCPDPMLSEMGVVGLEVNVVNSDCSSGSLSGGIISIPSRTCPDGSTMRYSVDGFVSQSSIFPPSYDQENAITISTRCVCDSDFGIVSPIASITTEPGSCEPTDCEVTNVVITPNCNIDGTYDLEVCFDHSNPDSDPAIVNIEVNGIEFNDQTTVSGCVILSDASFVGDETAGIDVSITDAGNGIDCSTASSPSVVIVSSDGSGDGSCSTSGEYIEIGIAGCVDCGGSIDLAAYSIEDNATNPPTAGNNSILISSGSLNVGETVIIYSGYLDGTLTGPAIGSQGSTITVTSTRAVCPIWNNGGDAAYVYDGSGTLLDSETTTGGLTTHTAELNIGCPVPTASDCTATMTYDAPECTVACTLPKITAFATCTDDGSGDKAALDEYYIQIDINSLGSDSDSDNEVTVNVGGTPISYSATGSYWVGPITHSGTGTATTSLSYENDGESCSGVVVVSETLCGYEVASGPICDCNEDAPGSLLAQVAPGSFDAVTSTMVYILVDGAGNVVSSNNTGFFKGLNDDTYTIYPYNVDVEFASLTAFTGSIPAAGSAYSDIMPDDGTCNMGCGDAVMTLDCGCRTDDVAIRKVLSSTGPFNIGDKVTFTISAYNQGTDPIYNVDVLDYLPAGLDFLSADNTANDFSANPNTSGGGTVTATVATTTPLLPGTNYPLTIVLTVNSSAIAGSDIVNYAEITGATEDENGDIPIEDDDSLLTFMGGGSGEIDDNINDGTTDALTDQDDFDMALLSLCQGLTGTVDSPTVCKGTTSASINLNVSSGTFEHIQIFYDPAAEAAGFEDYVPPIVPTPTDPTEYVIPGTLPDGVYNGVLVLLQDAFCSTSIPFTITVECPNCGTFPWDGSK